MPILALTALMFLSAPAAEGTASYQEAVRCAGLTQAASELEGGESRTGRTLYDAALFWSLSALQMAQSAARPAETAEADQTRARIRAVRELDADETAARAELQRCLARAPRLD
jgi:hypothetical protein